MIVMGGIIGSGIFVTPSTVARSVPRTDLILGAWLCGGLVALLGALAYGELAARRPDVGGQYAYLRDAYHPMLAFLYGWALLLVIQTGGMAASAITFARYALELSPLPISETMLAVLALAGLTLINCAGVRAGSGVQSLLMVLKILALLTLIACGLLAPGRAPAAPDSMAPGVRAFGGALAPVLFSYGGWQTASFVGGEIRDPRRNLPRALVGGVVGVVALYALVAWACVRVLGADGLASTSTPALDLMTRTLGRRGGVLVAAGIALSTLGFLSQSILTAPRVYFAMAQGGGRFFAGLGRLHPRTRVPVAAIALQGGLAALIALVGRFEQIVGYVVSIDFLFFGLTALALFRFRRQPTAGAEASFAMPGHPASTLLFVAVCWAVVAATFASQPRHSFIGLGLVLAGIPVFFVSRATRRLS